MKIVNNVDLRFDRFIGNTVVTAAVVETQQNIKMKTTLKLDFKFDSMTLVLYSPQENLVRFMYTQNNQDVIDILNCLFPLFHICTT